MEKREDLRRILASFPGRRMLVLGDLILDRYWWGDASRLSPEAPVPVVRKRRASTRPGGAANAAANLAALGATVELVGATGEDREADELRAVLSECGVTCDGVMAQPGRPTTTKTRVIAMHQQIVRVDDEDTGPLSERGSAVLLQAVSERLAGVDALVISDYAKGLLTPELLAAVIIAAQKVRTRVLVDPKGADAARYSGAYMIKPNRLELGLLTGAPVLDHAATDIAGQRLAEVLPGTLVLVTEGADGMSLFGCGDTIRVRPAARQVFDVTGAGDTVLATMAMAIASGAAPESAMELASEAAAIAISTLGTTAVTLQELRQAVDRG